MSTSRYIFSDDIVERVRSQFGTDADRVLDHLDRLPSTRDRNRDRLPAAVLQLAKGDVPSVAGLVEQALIDWQEVVSWVDDTR